MVVAAAEEEEAEPEAEDELGNADDEANELVAMLMTGSGSPLGSFQYVFLRSFPL